MSGHRHAAKTYGVAVVNHAIGSDGGKRVALLEPRNFFRKGYELRASQSFELGKAARVVQMLVAAEQDFNVGHFEAEGLDVVFNLRRGFDEAPVQNDVARWRDNQVRGDVRRADVVDVADDVKRRNGSVHGAREIVRLRVGRNWGDHHDRERDRKRSAFNHDFLMRLRVNVSLSFDNLSVVSTCHPAWLTRNRSETSGASYQKAELVAMGPRAR